MGRYKLYLFFFFNAIFLSHTMSAAQQLHQYNNITFTRTIRDS